MTVKELKEILNNYDEEYEIYYPQFVRDLEEASLFSEVKETMIILDKKTTKPNGVLIF